MSNRLSKIVTTTGDDGTTGMADGSRLAKNDIRVHCLGEIDELNAVTGRCISIISDQQSTDILLHIQHDLFDLGAELCQPPKQLMRDAHVEYINQQVEILNSDLPPLTEFILPGGSIECAEIHVARTVCRRAERSLVTLGQQQAVNSISLMYLNRLSDLLFVVARFLSRQSHQQETYWQSAYSRIKP